MKNKAYLINSRGRRPGGEPERGSRGVGHRERNGEFH